MLLCHLYDMEPNSQKHFQIERSRWKRTDNLDIWIDQYGRVRDMSSENPEQFKRGDGCQISNITQVRTFLPKNAAGVSFNNPLRYHGNNPKTWYFDNNEMLQFFNKKIGKLCDVELRKKGPRLLFESNGDNPFFSEIQKLVCLKTCLFDPIGYFKVCGYHLTLQDIANIDITIPGFVEELSLYDEFVQRPYPNIDLNILLATDVGRKQPEHLSSGVDGQREVRKFLIVLMSVFSCLEESIDNKIGSFQNGYYNVSKLEFKSSHVGLHSGLASPPLARWGWGPPFYPVDIPCCDEKPCDPCKKEWKTNGKLSSHYHWMNYHHMKEECPGSLSYPGAFHDHVNYQTSKEPEYLNGKMVYYCNIGGCPDECECKDCDIVATDTHNTQCREHIPDHPENFNNETDIKYHRKYFTESEVQNEFLSVKLPRMRKNCNTCTNNVLDHRFRHKWYHSFCNACKYMKMLSERSFLNVCKYCMKIFKDKYTLKKHVGIHSGEFVCDICENTFVNQVILERHKNEVHKPKSENSNVCEICDSSFTNARNLKDHMNIHTSNTYKCELCKQVTIFKQKRNLRRHYLSHHNIVSKLYLRLPKTQFKEHKCSICGKLFNRKERLVQHQKVNMCFSCPDCKFTCQDEKSLLEHTNQTHVKCKFCNFQTVYKFNLNKHIKKVHNKDQYL